VTVGWRAPTNLLWIVLENGVFLETGQQPIATSADADLATIARGAGFPTATAADDPSDLAALIERGLAEPGPTLIVARVGADATRDLPPLDPIRVKHRFMDALETG
jgi:thiamine pyrophosphate-dependent acetolactate synthase large subunit-like protein